MMRREVLGRYQGALFGLVWSFFNPILMLVVYTFVFNVVFKTRWGGIGDENKISFAIVLFVGLIIHGLFAECVNRAPSLIIYNTSYVKKIVFPLEILPVVAMGSTLFHTLASLTVLLSGFLIVNNQLHWTVLLFPIVTFPLIVTTMGITWFLASLGVFVRDVGQTVGIVTTIMLFLSPVFFPVSALPKEIQFWMIINPLTFMIEQSREILIWGRLPNWVGLAIYMCGSLVVAWAGYWWFQKTRKGFADVL
jgi:lipopolysaccharide transport system permease protein